ncbi:MAG TPA: hypothetical protein VIS51_06220 [Solirubrobacterales bacterium]
MTCIFCGRTGKMSKEHLWPEWVRRTLKDDEMRRRIPHSIGHHDERPPKEWSAPAFTATIKGVCVPCNTGWMAQIEGIVKEFAEPLVKGEPRFLSKEAQMFISAWSYMKILVLERVDRGRRILPKDRYQRVFNAAQVGGMTVPSTATVFIAAHVGGLAGQYQHRGLAPRGHGASRPDLFVGTFTLRHLVVQVIDNLENDGPRLPGEREPEVDGRDRSIWPPTRRNLRLLPPARGLRWPSSAPLSDDELTIFAGPLPDDYVASAGF